MCLATAAVAAVALTAATSVASGVAQSNAANYQSAVARNNALIEKQNAAYAASAGAANAEKSGLQERAKLAQLRAGIAANGVDVNSGTAVDLQESQHALGDLDTRTVSNRSALETYGYESKATGYTAESRLKSMEGDNALIQGGLGAATAVASSPTALGALGVAPSQISGNPSVGSAFQWMQPGGGMGGS